MSPGTEHRDTESRDTAPLSSMADSVAKGEELFKAAQKKLKSFSFFGGLAQAGCPQRLLELIELVVLACL